ncbi:MAG: trypsin-like peptidase domain-containing protein [bacterium]|nr:trypsin-like peptidase domain-containing protein [bacterium]
MKRGKSAPALYVLWLACSMVILMAIPAFADGFDVQTRNGVVVIYTKMEDSSSYGTGFFVGKQKENPQYLLTNYHVVEDYLNHGGGTNKSTAKLLVVYDLNQMEEAYVVDVLEEKDLALLRINRATDKRKSLVLSVPKENYVGNLVYAVGYPGVADNVHDSLSYYSIEDATVTSGSMSRLLTESGTGRMLIQMDAEINSGNSGGPLVDKDGYVIGVNVEGVMTTVVGVAGDKLGVSQVKTPGVNFAVNIEEALPLLNRNNIIYETASERPNLVLYCSAAGFAVLLFVLVVILIQKKKKTGMSVTAASKKAEKKSVRHSETAAAPKQMPFVRSLSIQHNGMRFPVGAQQMLIGRDHSVCRLTYRDGTPGVSAKHCSLQWDEAAGEFLLTDLHSSYGTYLINGQKLTPGISYHLRSGDSFYLGDRSNELRVELG